MDRIPTQKKPFSNENINHDLKVPQRRFSMVELKTLALKTFPASCPPMQFAAQGQLVVLQKSSSLQGDQKCFEISSDIAAPLISCLLARKSCMSFGKHQDSQMGLF